MKMKKAINNLINGNMTDAKNFAKNFKYGELFDFAQNEYGMNDKKADATASMLKGYINFNEYCRLTD
jgi:hypothetical protein